MDPQVDQACLSNQSNESEMMFRPPFGMSKLLRSNKIISVSHIVNLMLGASVPGEILDVIKCHPFLSFMLPDVVSD